MTDLLRWAPWVCAAAALLSLWLAAAALRGRRVIAASGATLVALLWLSVAALITALGAGLVGYRALTNEDVALTVLVTPLANGHFLADARFPEGRAASWELAGDQLYVDARILKWRLEQERTAPHTLFALGAPKRFDLFAWIKRKTWMAPLVDAEYGSGTFIDVHQSTIYEVRVSTTGLLIRKVE